MASTWHFHCEGDGSRIIFRLHTYSTGLPPKTVLDVALLSRRSSSLPVLDFATVAVIEPLRHMSPYLVWIPR